MPCRTTPRALLGTCKYLVLPCVPKWQCPSTEKCCMHPRPRPGKMHMTVGVAMISLDCFCGSVKTRMPLL